MCFVTYTHDIELTSLLEDRYEGNYISGEERLRMEMLPSALWLFTRKRATTNAIRLLSIMGYQNIFKLADGVLLETMQTPLADA